MRASLLTIGRRYAAGIDVAQDEVRMIILSRRLCGAAHLRVEHVARAALPADAVAGARWLDPQAVAAALVEVFAGFAPGRAALGDRPGSMSGLRCAMALPPAATVIGRAPLAHLAQQAGTAPDWWRGACRHPLNALEPSVLAHAERLAGIERSTLAVDWYIAEPQAPEQVAIVSTPREYIETRVEAAAAAGITLSAIEGEPAAALRACCHAAAIELDAGEDYGVLWIGVDGLCGWQVSAGAVRREWLYPRAGQACAADALRAFGAGCGRSCVFIAGAPSLLADADLSLSQLGALLECIVLPFDLAPYREPSAGPDPRIPAPAACAVAFGLALRGLRE